MKWHRDYSSGDLIHRLTAPDGATAMVEYANNPAGGFGWRWETNAPGGYHVTGWADTMLLARRAAASDIAPYLRGAMTQE